MTSTKIKERMRCDKCMPQILSKIRAKTKNNDNVLEAITKLNKSLNAFSINKNFKENDKFRNNYSNNKGQNN
jgi:hypothetical protein